MTKPVATKPLVRLPPREQFVVAPSRNKILQAAWAGHIAAQKKEKKPVEHTVPNEPSYLFAKLKRDNKKAARSLATGVAKLVASANKSAKAFMKEADAKLAHPKESVVESEPYRRLVAAMPCARCQLAGYSQAAHPPPSGKGIKADDRECIPLCTLHPGARGRLVKGCHEKFDQYELMPKTKARAWALRIAKGVRRTIAAAGQWPKKLALYESKK